MFDSDVVDAPVTGGPVLYETAAGILSYEEIDHSYRLPSGVRPRGLTNLLRDQGIADAEFVSEVARERGSDVHAAIPLAIAGTLDWARLPGHLFGYVTAALDALRFLRAVAEEIEQPVFSLSDGVAGRPDGIFRIHVATAHEVRALVEWKSLSSGRTPHPAAKVQTAGYAAMKYEMDGTVIPARIAIALMRDGGFNVLRYDDPDDFKEYRAAAFINRRRRERGQIK
jgi:hypothetical protein